MLKKNTHSGYEKLMLQTKYLSYLPTHTANHISWVAPKYMYLSWTGIIIKENNTLSLTDTFTIVLVINGFTTSITQTGMLTNTHRGLHRGTYTMVH